MVLRNEVMRLGIRVRLAGLTLSNTSKEIESFGVQRSRKAVHDWVKKADLQHASGASSDQIAVDETMTCINGQQYWLYAAVNPNSNKFLHIWMFPTTTTALTEQFVRSYARNTTSSMSFIVITPSISKQHYSELSSDSKPFGMES